MAEIVKRKEIAISRQDFVACIFRLLSEGRHREAARHLWPWMVQNDWTELIWDRMEKHRLLCIMGHGSASKTFTAVAKNLLDWWSKPTTTAAIFTSDTVDSMKRRVWADLKILYMKGCERTGAMPGTLLDKILRSSPTDGKHAIHAIAAESDEAQSKIQGLHTERIRVLFDEADNKFSNSIWSALANLGTSGDLRVTALANPINRSSEFGRNCEPIDGWDSVTPETDFEWQSKTGWHVLRLDGLRSPNFTSKTFFPFLLTPSGLEDIKNRYGGEESREWWAYVRAWFPPEGSANIIFPIPIVNAACEKVLVWHASTRPVAFCDSAFDGGDTCVLCIGRTGRLADNVSRPAVEAAKFIKIGRKDLKKPVTIDFADQLIERCKQEGVTPEDFGVDGTGTGIGFSDYIKHRWSMKILSVCFGGSPTDLKSTAEDSTPAKDRYDRFISELWFTTREWMRLGMLTVSNAPRQLRDQLTARTYELMSKNKIRIEKKEDMKSRGLESPDFADALCGLCHLVRVRAENFTPGTIKDASQASQFHRIKKQANDYEADYGVRG